ncbi:Galactoside 2-alpha-L-fucosyltransferase [Dichanthelium oligosanthes]|uniref:Fucosyltransferase n=1 Tax=Dichanthelium oligosanthes TaxID=888268 RepID=A0A1E5UUI1_9POAL|nr:Galactoside 2-alpha-L-fucosyltransferase [Dichanthelium oligosanthes]
MDVETSGGVAGAAPKLEDDAAALARDKESRHRRVLFVAGLMVLLLLAFFVLGRESASTVWEIASAKLTSMNNGQGTDDASYAHNAGSNATKGRAADELFGGLLAPGMDRWSCRSRYQSSWYYKHFPYTPSPHLLRKLRTYEARHRRCGPGTPLYAKSVEQLKSGRSVEGMECSYIVWLPFEGLGNRMLSMVSGFLYALLTDRVLLVAMPPDSADLFCEPFPGTTWLLPLEDFPVANLFGLGPSPDISYTSLLNNKKIVVDGGDPANNATAAVAAPPVPSYVYVSLGWQMTDGPFFCGEHQLALGQVNWLLLYSDLYFVPSLYPIAEFQDELRRLFPSKESASHLLLRYLIHPANTVWGLVTRYYHSYLAPATKRIGVQIRMFGHSSIPVDDMYNQILACSRQEHNILPETDDDEAATTVTVTSDGGGSGNNGSTAILIASLYGDYYERLRSRYYEHAAKDGGGWVGVFQPTHDERQATENLAHNQKALAEIYLLSFSEELMTSGLSTFGYVSSSLAGVRPTILLTAFDHKVPETPCRRAVSMEPCNLTPPRGVECRGKAAVDGEDLAAHVEVCEDFHDGVKLFD